MRKGERRWKNLQELDAYGAQGWELVLVGPTQFGGDTTGLQNQFWAFFKRPTHNVIETTTQEALDRAGPPPNG